MNTKKSISFMICSIVLVLFIFSITLSAQTVQQIDNKVMVACPKNLAVLHTLVIIASPQTDQDKMFPHPLAKKSINYFKPFKSHPAVQMSRNLYKQMWYFPFNYMAFHFSEFPEAEQISRFPSDFEIDENMKTFLTNYINQVNDFYVKSDFDKFWQECSDDIMRIMENVKNDFPDIDLPNMMEQFYGRSIERFYLIPCPFMTNSATHVEVQKNGEWSFYHLAGPDLFSDPFINVYTAFHEFSHSFIEPISREYSQQIDRLAYLYKPLQQRFSRMGYRDWDRAFNEHMVTAGQLHFTRIAFGENRKSRMLQREKNRGFQLIERFYNHLNNYNENRDRYKNLRDYYPVLLEDLTTIRVDSFRTAGPMGFYPEYDNDICRIKDVVSGSAIEQAGVKKGDLLIAVEDMKITSSEKLAQAKDKYWNHAEEGDQISIRIKRDGEKIRRLVSVPFVVKYQYMENDE